MPPASPQSASAQQQRCDDALLVMLLLQLDPLQLGGVHLRSRDAELTRCWLQQLRALKPPASPWRRMPLQISDERLLGGIDLETSLQQGRAVYARGLLAEVDQGYLHINMVERLPQSVSARLCAVLDQHRVDVQRDGIHASEPSRFAVIAVDEGEEDEHIPQDLLDRLAFTLRLDGLRGLLDSEPGIDAEELAELRGNLPAMLAALHMPDTLLRALCGSAVGLGLYSLRASQQAVRVAMLLALLEDAEEVTAEHAGKAAQLVLAPRARQLPVSEDSEQPDDEVPDEQEQEQEPPQDDTHSRPIASRRNLQNHPNRQSHQQKTIMTNSNPLPMSCRKIWCWPQPLPPYPSSCWIVCSCRCSNNGARHPAGRVPAACSRGHRAGVR